ncbi:hypothetical protein [Desulfosarcina sp.]|uniref:hypothetical protein n=1 Tax=Desulfosarcina sp. TaxID=2027861 RepID=UPI0029B4753B|nr:hypothetical protein [Desulfosarcina sp.]MDX2455303.1 hypothetical protein [Desulfosarcina sp.]
MPPPKSPLIGLADASIEEKAGLIQSFYQDVAFHESGIMYSLMKIDGDVIRPFEPRDFVGIESFDFEGWRIKPAGPWEYRNNENSITTSGIYLAAQTARFQATADEAAMVQALKAFRSLDLIYRFGEEDGRPGWMGKPYGFRLSDQTSGDQYLDAIWGLWSFLQIAPEKEAARATEMLIGFADHWRRIDYTIFYLSHTWSNKHEEHAYNAIFMAINRIAFHLTGDPVYQAEADRFHQIARWPTETGVGAWKRKIRTGEIGDWMFNKLVEDHLGPNEFLCWETTIHSKFTALSAEIIHDLAPDILSTDDLATTLETWWKTWPIGMGEDLLPFYFFIVDVEKDTWRPAPRTKRLPRDQWLLGQPGLSYTSQRRWMEPLCRFLVTSVIAAEHSTAVRQPAIDLARRIMESIDAVRIKWQHDPDGNQIVAATGEVKEVLSSEMPASYLAAFWRGRIRGYW